MLKNIKIQQLFLAFSASVLLFSCTEDLSTPESSYVDVNSVKISFEKDSYVLLQPDTLMLSPVLDPSIKDNRNYTYSWVTGYGSREGEVLSTEKDIAIYSKQFQAKSYELFFRVHDETEGLVHQKKIDINIFNPFHEGWVTLSDVDGESILSMVSLLQAKDADGTIVHDEKKLYYNILDHEDIESNVNLQGAPLYLNTVLYVGDFGKDFCYVVSTTEESRYIRGSELSDLGPVTKHRVLAGAPWPDPAIVVNIAQTSAAGYASRLMLDDGGIYPSYSFYGKNIVFSVAGGGPMKISPYIAGGGTSVTNHYFTYFDENSRSFVRGVSSTLFSPNYFQSITDVPGSKFNYNDTGKDLLFMQTLNFRGSNPSFGAAVLKDPVDDKVYYGIFDAHGHVIQEYYNEVTGPDIENATMFAAAPKYGHLFYVAGSKVYMFNAFANQGQGSTEEVLDLGGEEITVFKFNNFRNRGGYLDLENKLIICTYGGSKESGKISFYNVPSRGKISLNYSYDGLGKIVGVNYRERRD